MANLISGPTVWSRSVDEQGFRTYRLNFLVRVDLVAQEGPAAAGNACLLAFPSGSPYAVDGDADLFCWFRNDEETQPHPDWKPTTPCEFFIVTRTASNKPPAVQRCVDAPNEDPLSEPDKYSGSLVSQVEEQTHDYIGTPFEYSSHEQIRGPIAEFLTGYDVVKIEQNRANLELGLLSALKFHLNDAPMWGLPPRCILFAGYTWERLFHGQCQVYFKRRLELWLKSNSRVRVTSTAEGTGAFLLGHDRETPDESSKVLKGHWGQVSGALAWILDDVTLGEPPDRDNPAHFIQAIDHPAGNPTRLFLDGNGVPYLPAVAGTGEVDFGGALDCDDLPIMQTLLLNKTYIKTTVGGDLTLNQPGEAIAFKFTGAAEGKVVVRVLSGKPDEVTMIVYDDTCFRIGADDPLIPGIDGSAGSTTIAGNVVTRTWFHPDPTSIMWANVILGNPTGFDGFGLEAATEDLTYTVKVVANDPDDTGPGNILLQGYPEGNLLLLGVPAELD